MAVPQSKDPEEDAGAALGETLKDLRLAAGFTTREAAGARIGYSKDSIGKAETGGHVPTLEMLLLLLDLYQAPELVRKTVLRLHAFARKSRGPIPEYFEVYISREKLATFVRLWGLLLIPGPLQVYGYAHAMFMTRGIDEDEAAEKANARVERGAALDGPNAAHATVLIYEPVLSLRVGTSDVMVAQLERLLEVSRRRNVILQIVPAAGYFPGLEGEFAIISGPAIPDTVDMLAVKDHVSDDPEEVRTAAELFEEIRGYALNVAESRARIQEVLQLCRSQQQTLAGASPATATAQDRAV